MLLIAGKAEKIEDLSEEQLRKLAFTCQLRETAGQTLLYKFSSVAGLNSERSFHFKRGSNLPHGIHRSDLNLIKCVFAPHDLHVYGLDNSACNDINLGFSGAISRMMSGKS